MDYRVAGVRQKTPGKILWKKTLNREDAVDHGRWNDWRVEVAGVRCRGRPKTPGKILWKRTVGLCK